MSKHTGAPDPAEVEAYWAAVVVGMDAALTRLLDATEEEKVKLFESRRDRSD